jgi:capsular exopolysaccharide synthesis family protein
VLDGSLDSKLVVHHDPTGRAAEQHRSFRTNLMATNPRNEPRALLFTSAEAGAGKSVSVANLALSLAECQHLNVCLVDADLRARGLSELFGLASAPGLADVLLQRKEPQRVLRATSRSNLTLLPAGSPEESRSGALGSSYLPELISWLKRKHHYVLIDSAPVLLFSDAGELAQCVDGVILAVAIDGTLRHEADEALAQLRIAGASVLGTIVTGAESAGDYAYDLREYEDVEA